MKILIAAAWVIAALVIVDLAGSIRERSEDRAYTITIQEASRVCAVAIDGKRSVMQCWEVGDD